VRKLKDELVGTDEEKVELALVDPNGGFPEPPAGARVRVVGARHDACGETTRVRLPASLAPQTVRHVVCRTCAEPFDDPAVEDIGLEPGTRRAMGIWLSRLRLPDPQGRAWRYLSVPLAAAAVIGALWVIQGSGDPKPEPTPAASADAPASTVAGGHAKAAAGGTGGSKRVSDDARFVRESTFAVALPPGWQRTTPAAGATFAASAPNGQADATLWVERDPNLAFATFEARSMDQLRQLAGSAHIVDRVAAPTADASVVTLAADAPPNAPRYEVTLRASGPYRYYLATTVEPDASAAAADGVDLIHGSFQPQGAK
jgi:hypothetical protein